MTLPEVHKGGPSSFWEMAAKLSQKGMCNALKRRSRDEEDDAVLASEYVKDVHDAETDLTMRTPLRRRRILVVQNERVGTGCSMAAKGESVLSPRFGESVATRPPWASRVPSTSFRTPPPSTRSPLPKPCTVENGSSTALLVGTAQEPLPARGAEVVSAAVLPKYDPICIGFFAKKAPSPLRLPKCLSHVTSRPHMLLSKTHEMEEDKAELLSLLKAAAAEGAVVMTSSA
jgi:hypothetical protein